MIKKRNRLSIKCKGFARVLGVVDPSKITKRIKWFKKDVQEKCGKLTGGIWSLS